MANSKFQPVLLTSLLLLALSWVSLAQAHDLSTAQLQLSSNANNSGPATLTGEYLIGLADVQASIDLDPNNDGALYWSEVTASQAKIAEFVQELFSVSAAVTNGKSSQPARQSACVVHATDSLAMKTLYGDKKLSIGLEINCGDQPKPYTLIYKGLGEQVPGHKLLLSLTSTQLQLANSEQANQSKSAQHISKQIKQPGQTQQSDGFAQYLLDLDNTSVVLESSQSAFEIFSLYVYQGFLHILIGLDHVLFLICLLLPFGLQSTKHKTKASYLLACATGFTLGHSVTLALGLLGYAPTTPEIIELLIAGSVFLTALNVVTQWVRSVLGFSLLFGLVHGYGFSGVLQELGLPSQFKLPAFFGFNIGVELGQILIMLVALPVLYQIRTKLKWGKALVYLSAGAIMILTCLWIYERALLV
mgnify:CR=1 FL=1